MSYKQGTIFNTINLIFNLNSCNALEGCTAIRKLFGVFNDLGPGHFSQITADSLDYD